MSQTPSPIIVSIACPNRRMASQIGQELVTKKLVACAQLFPIHSIYRWEGAVQSEDEVLLQAKTLSDKFSEIQTLVQELHEYDVPELIATPITQVLPTYLDWLKSETR